MEIPKSFLGYKREPHRGRAPPARVARARRRPGREAHRPVLRHARGRAREGECALRGDPCGSRRGHPRLPAQPCGRAVRLDAGVGGYARGGGDPRGRRTRGRAPLLAAAARR